MKIELVYGTKMPFIEHTKDERKSTLKSVSDVDYFISIQQTGPGGGRVIVAKICGMRNICLPKGQ
jgi:hypothetical protein